MELVNICAAGVTLYGLDKEGQVWFLSKSDIWKKAPMETEGCPECGMNKDKPEQYVKADGHGRLNKFCENSFHT